MTLERWSAASGLLAGFMLAVGSLAPWFKARGGGYVAPRLEIQPWARWLIVTAAGLYGFALILLIIAVARE